MTKISLKITYLKIDENLPGANDLTFNVQGPSYLGLN